MNMVFDLNSALSNSYFYSNSKINSCHCNCRVPRQGKDVQGLYPGQLGRIHVVHSQDHR